MGETKIEWASKTWNPIRARNLETGKVGWWCSHIAPGCKFCYAEKLNVQGGGNPGRMGNGVRYAEDQAPKIELFLDQKTLEEPLHWKTPQRVFPCSMTDLFHPLIPAEFTTAMFDVMHAAERHEYLCLTKRPGRIAPVLYGEDGGFYLGGGDYYPNIVLMTSVSEQESADKNIPELLQTGIGWRYGVSYEPALGPVDFTRIQVGRNTRINALEGGTLFLEDGHCDYGKLAWGIFGGESGPGARACNIEWARKFVRQFREAGVPCFVKQLGGRTVFHWGEQASAVGLTLGPVYGDQMYPVRLKDPKGGDMAEWPEDLRVREMPK